ncbi:hypothetical protein KPB05_37265 [Burkholderia gladioli]|uniref:hypothetical protein n=1 Tax=Burkholderia gladioli TaxID=28095 RepID=UPI00285D91F8|nr:hypothetical protein [Burkholderia gladioli]MDR8093109.1 hypothetical protein [Burkholderia gladioli]
MTVENSISVNEIKLGDRFASVRRDGTAATGGTITKVGPVDIEFSLSYMGRIRVEGVRLPKANLVGGCVLREGKLFEVIE